MSDGYKFTPIDLKAAQGVLSRSGVNVTGDFTGTADTDATLIFPAASAVCAGGGGPDSPCVKKAVQYQTVIPFSSTRLGNTSGAQWWTWDQHNATSIIPSDFMVEGIGDVNGDGIADIVYAHTDPFKLFPDPVTDIRVRTAVRTVDSGNSFGVETASCVGPSLADMRKDFVWYGSVFEPDNNSSKPHVALALADMNGDSLADIVMVGPTEVAYWPGDGRGNFAACRGAGCACGQAASVSVPSVRMLGVIPKDITSQKQWRFADLNGDGYADLVAVGKDGIRIYLNRGGADFATPVFLAGSDLFQDDWARVVADPTALKISFADMNGNGITDLLLEVGSRVVTYDLFQRGNPIDDSPLSYASREGLLTGIDNGYGAMTQITYTTTSELAKAAIAEGNPWVERVPQNLHVVTRLTTGTNMPGDTPDAILYAYKNPAWDGYERRFKGFRDVITKRLSVPAVSTHAQFFIPPCDDHDCSRITDASRAASGSPTLSETFDDTGRYLTSIARSFAVVQSPTGFFTYPSQVDTRLCDTTDWQASDAAGVVTIAWGDRQPILKEKVPVRCAKSALLRTTQLLDQFGNVRQTVDFGHIKDDGTPIDNPITTQTTYLAARPDWRFLADGTVVAGFPNRPLVPNDQSRISSFSYDSAGRLQAIRRYLIGTASLVRHHAGGGAVAPSTPPQAAAEKSWITEASFTYDQYDNITLVQGSDGRCEGIQYDPEFNQLPVRIIRYKDGCGSVGVIYNSVDNRRHWDRGLQVPYESIAPNGTLARIRYDGFGRATAWWLPDPVTGATQPSPSTTQTFYDVAGGPVQEIKVSQFSDATHSRAAWEYQDALGRTVLSLAQADPAHGDGGNWVASGFPEYGPGHAITGVFSPWFYSGDPAAHPLHALSSDVSRTKLDAFGRTTDAFGLDGSTTVSYVYHPLETDALEASKRWTRTVFDGHGRVTDQSSASGSGPPSAAGTGDFLHIQTIYQAGGEPAVVRRLLTDGSEYASRWMAYDSLGRLVWNVEPNTTRGFDRDPASSALNLSWRYAYNGAGDVVGTSDARGCGENLFYDALGRLTGEDYSPCLTSQAPYSPPGNTSIGQGLEAFYRYDATEIAKSPGKTAPINLLGRLVARMDRGAHDRYEYDWRGSSIAVQRQIARPPGSDGVWPAESFLNPPDRYATSTFTQTLQYDGMNRLLGITTGAQSPELLGTDGQSAVKYEYTARGLINSIASTYGPLIASATYAVDGQTLSIVHGDAANTTTRFQYDRNGRAAVTDVRRIAPSFWTTGAPGYTPPPTGSDSTVQQVLMRSVFQFGATGLLDRVDDARVGSEWPTGAKPVSAAFTYDRALHTEKVVYMRATADPYVDFDGMDANLAQNTPPSRVLYQQYGFNNGGNVGTSDDDAHAFYARSLGTVQEGTPANGIDQLRGTTDGAIASRYDEAGNLIDLVVRSKVPCTDSSQLCQHRFVFDWDEVGYLARARRWDYADISAAGADGTDIPTAVPIEDLRYRYDAVGHRVLSSRVSNGAPATQTAEVFETLNLEKTQFDATQGSYLQDSSTEVVLFPGIGRAFVNGTLPRMGNSNVHVLLDFADYQGSLAAVIDRETSELVERTTYQTQGKVDTDWRPARWSALSPRASFAGKPSDPTLDLSYFGARYYAPSLGVWLSADPLTIHGHTGAPSPYTYADGQASMRVDRDGMQSDATGARCVEQCLMDRMGITAADLPTLEEEEAQDMIIAPEAALAAPSVTDAQSLEVTSAAAPTAKKSPEWTGIMRVLMNAAPFVAYGMITDPDRTLRTVVNQRLEMVENLLGEPNSTSDLSYTPARDRGSSGQAAMDDTDQLISITENEIAGRVLGAAGGKIIRGAGGLLLRESRVLVPEASGGFTGFSAACPGGVCMAPGTCFAAGTLVATPHGSVAIETIKVGDEILSQDETAPGLVTQRVTKTMFKPEQVVLALTVSSGMSDERIVVTPNHPFRVKGEGWRPAGSLHTGTELESAERPLHVTRVEKIEERQNVYNLEVDQTHTYFAGKLGAWVHNSCPTVFGGSTVPGMYANESGWITLRSAERDFTIAERRANNINGDLFGCHTCGTFRSGLLFNHWVLDHQPPVGFRIPGITYRGYPQCASCGLIRSGYMSQPRQILWTKWR
jgi:RHS repeat-associated protein